MDNKNIIKKEIVFSTPWFEIEEKIVNDENSPYYGLNTLDYVTILALTNTDEILFVKQYRPILEKYTLELPSGHVDFDRTPIQAGRDELLEETGYKADKLELLGCINPDPGRINNKLWCFYTNEIQKMDTQQIEIGIEVLPIPLKDINEYIEQEEINHSMNLSLFFLARKQLRL